MSRRHRTQSSGRKKRIAEAEKAKAEAENITPEKFLAGTVRLCEDCKTPLTPRESRYCCECWDWRGMESE